nr:putative transcriptional regulatory protein c11d3.07c [Quercus suber]
MLLPVPAHVLQALRASEPYRVEERAWLIMFYTIALKHVSQEEPHDEVKRAKLRKNLWWAFNDIRLFLKPSVIGVHALLLMMRHAEEYMTPSICWSLVAKACNMLQTVESDQWAEPNPSMDPRTVVFWRLNLLDKSLALALNRVPTIAGNIASQKPLPSLQQFMAPADARTPRLFEAHFGRQMAQLSLLMGEIWECAHGQRLDSRRVSESLDAWHTQASQASTNTIHGQSSREEDTTDFKAKVLEAAALVERPLLTDNANNVPTPFEIGLNTVHCQYNFVAVYLTVPFRDQQYPNKPSEVTITSRRMLDFLPSLTSIASHLKGPFAPDLCQLLQCPIISFGTLWAQSMSMLRSDINQSRLALEAMAKAPPFFAQFSLRNILAVRMKNTTEQMIEHSRLLLSPQVPEAAPQLNQQTQPDQQSQEMSQRISTRSTRQGMDSNVIWTDETTNNTEPEPFWSADLDDWLAELNDNFFDGTRGISQWK